MWKFLRREEIDNVTSKRDYQHHWHLLPFGLVDDTETKRKGGDEEEAIVLIHLVGAGGRGRGVGVHEAIDSGANCDTETEKQ